MTFMLYKGQKFSLLETPFYLKTCRVKLNSVAQGNFAAAYYSA